MSTDRAGAQSAAWRLQQAVGHAVAGLARDQLLPTWAGQLGDVDHLAILLGEVEPLLIDVAKNAVEEVMTGLGHARAGRKEPALAALRRGEKALAGVSRRSLAGTFPEEYGDLFR